MNEPRSSFEKEVIERLTAIETALGGDRMKGEGGLLHFSRRIMEDVYGTEHSKTDSFMARMSRVEDTMKRQKWTLAGVALALGAGGSLVKDAIKHLFGG